jgi:hypothetical protein
VEIGTNFHYYTFIIKNKIKNTKDATRKHFPIYMYVQIKYKRPREMGSYGV